MTNCSSGPARCSLQPRSVARRTAWARSTAHPVLLLDAVDALLEQGTIPAAIVAAITQYATVQAQCS